MLVSSHVKKYFWDIDTSRSDTKAHPEYYIQRILEYGDKKAVVWLKKTYGAKKIKEIAKKVKLSPKSKNYWTNV